MPEVGDRPFSAPLSAEDRTLSNEAIAWFARLRSGNLSEQDKRNFEVWKDRSPAHERAWREVCALWTEPEFVAAVRAASRIHGHEQHYSQRRLWGWRMAALAAVLLVVFIGAVQLDLLPSPHADYMTATGERRTLQLEDGSAITLNTSTAVAAHFDRHTRRVRLLKGEAFFAVEPDASRPFAVDSQGVVTRAVGTKFLVRQLQDGVRVTVVEGLVEIGTGLGTAQVQLAGGQEISVGPDGPSPPHRIDPDAATAWMRGRLVFDSAPLPEVIEEVARYYPGYVFLAGSTIRGLRVSGTYLLADPRNVLITLSQTLPIHLAHLSDKFVILY